MFEFWKSVARPIIGMLHAPPLPGAPHYAGPPAKIIDHVLRDVEALVAGGVDGLMLENFGDAPFYPGRVPVLTATHLTALAARVRGATDLPLGINILRNDGQTALAIAHAVGASFIRVNVFTGARVADQGVLQGIAHDLLRERAVLHAQQIRIFADASVKHSAPLGPGRPLADEIADMVKRGGADAIVISGAGTGQATAVADVEHARAAAAGRPVFVGSGVTAATIRSFAGCADGFIVGTSFKAGGDPTQPIDAERVRTLVGAWKE